MIRWLLPLTAILVGAMVGMGSFTFGYARGYSYLGNDPGACANCHVMNQQYSAWLKSSHRAVAACNDCHAPHDDVVGKYLVKAQNGFWHSFYFTTGTFQDPIRITAGNREVTEGTCRYCHEGIAQSLVHGTAVPEFDRTTGLMTSTGTIACTRCHADVGHATH